ncbi:glycoside hydrolase family 16 protein [Pedobacter rhodius]|uniref:Glycoside hydrolase family 16 protein n=1 Tax=Pedobacter rhodius TaxID=3004098 RepID=A0ABT4KTS3_9SPHI|nr:glycoside hydrolase family 16 protein [Pedobacter sp. SJ11]MCZ4222175.1 glycoside hydrolase family 16 protein [Pedobacter sp. SJ11]
MKLKYFLSFSAFILFVVNSVNAQQVAGKYAKEGYKLVWSDEFEKDGMPDAKNWTYEKGFVRNEELQWYQPENAFCKSGLLIIEARKEQKPNPLFEEGSSNWRKKSKNIEYTSACLITKGLQSFQYGRFEMRGRIDISAGLWPAFWTLGDNGNWPANGEIDIMEYYRGKLLANIASLGANKKPKWFSNTKSTEALGGKKWVAKFHVWRMDWDSEAISLYVDDLLLNKTPMAQLKNDDSTGINPFMQKHYILLDLAMGGLNGGDLNDTKFPNRMEVDYVRVYQK